MPNCTGKATKKLKRRFKSSKNSAKFLSREEMTKGLTKSSMMFSRTNHAKMSKLILRRKAEQGFEGGSMTQLAQKLIIIVKIQLQLRIVKALRPIIHHLNQTRCQTNSLSKTLLTQNPSLKPHHNSKGKRPYGLTDISTLSKMI